VESKRVSLTELRAHLLACQRLPNGALEALREDARAGAKALLAQLLAHRAAERSETRRLYRLLHHERELWAEGRTLIAGVDEAGMAPLAGPVVAAAAILPRDFRPRGLDDSKKLDAETRDRLAIEVKASAVCWAVGLASVEEIDRINIYHAGLLAMHRAVQALSPRAEVLLVDARKVPDVDVPQRSIIHGDELSLSIAAASVIAKTHRDALLGELDERFPGYGFNKHKGYPTPTHLAALRRLGPCDIHRRSFEPVRAALGLQGELFPSSETTAVQELPPFVRDDMLDEAPPFVRNDGHDVG
jgi:ribonuclease HII